MIHSGSDRRCWCLVGLKWSGQTVRRNVHLPSYIMWRAVYGDEHGLTLSSSLQRASLNYSRSSGGPVIVLALDVFREAVKSSRSGSL